MTHAEIIKNIKYNENLVESYRKNICDLQTKINELNRLKSKYSTLQSNFSAKQSKRRSKFNSNFSGIYNLKIISSYVSGMENLLTGNEYKNAFNGLSAAIDRINSQIRKLQNQLNDYNTKFEYRKNRVLFWREQLKKVSV